jgi:hypothetical protein
MGLNHVFATVTPECTIVYMLSNQRIFDGRAEVQLWQAITTITRAASLTVGSGFAHPPIGGERVKTAHFLLQTAQSPTSEGPPNPPHAPIWKPAVSEVGKIRG